MAQKSSFTIELWLLDFEIERWKRYVQTVSEGLERAYKEYEEWLSTSLDEMSEEERDDFAQHYSGELEDFQEHFPEMAYAGTFFSIYAYFESQLVGICKSLQIRNQNRIGVDDLAGSGVLNRCQAYFEKVFVLEFPSGTSGWRDINDMRRVRNVLAHSHGFLEPDRKPGKTRPTTRHTSEHKKVRKFIERSNGLRLEQDQIVIEKEFCLTALTTIRDFISCVYDTIPDDVWNSVKWPIKLDADG